MAFFDSSDEVYRLLGGLFERAVTDDGLAAATVDSGVVARLRLSEPECQLVLDLPGRRVLLGESGAKAVVGVELEMAADAAHALWLGRVQPAVLLATRKVRVRGSVRKLLRMQSIGERLIPMYEQVLLDADRADLLTAAPASHTTPGTSVT